MKKYFLPLMLLFISSTLFTLSIKRNIEFKQNCSGYLKHASDANTVETAKEELHKAINYLEEKISLKGTLI